MSKRENWSNKFAFVMSTAGAAVGLGNIWRFPYICGENGGGAFIVVYMILIFAIGMPIMISELTIGRASKKGSGGAFTKLIGNKKSKVWRTVGLLGVIIAFIVSSYYSIIAGWTLDYLYESFSGKLVHLSNSELQGYFDHFMGSDNAQIFWHVIFTILTTLILSGVISSSVEWFNKITMPFLFLILIGLMVFSLNIELEGNWSNFFQSETIDFLFKPKWENFTRESFFRALGQAAFTLSIASGTMISYGSYLNKKEDVVNLSAIVVVMDTFVAILAGLMIFPIIFHYGLEPGSGTGLVFISLPSLFSQIPGGAIFSLVFYFLLCFAALSSSIAILEPVVTHLIDEVKYPRRIAAGLSGFLSLILGITWIKVSTLEHSGTFTNVDKLVSDLLIPIESVAICVFVGWALRKKLFLKTLNSHSPLFNEVLYFVVKWICPIGIFLILLNTF